MKITLSTNLAIAGMALMPLGAAASFLKGGPAEMSTNDIFKNFNKTIQEGTYKGWAEALKITLGDPGSAPAPLIPMGGSPAEPLGFVSFLNQLSDGDVNVTYGSINVPAFAAELSVPKNATELPKVVFRVGDRGSGDDRGAIHLSLLHLVRGTTPISIGSSLAYKTVGDGLSIWGSTGDGLGQKEWIYLPADADRTSGEDLLVGLYAIEGGLFSTRKEKCSVDDALKVCNVVEIVSETDEMTWLEVKAPVAYDENGENVNVVLEIWDDGKQLAVVLPKLPHNGPMLIDPVWTQSNDMILGRRLHTATRLSDGRVLVAGGIDETNQLTKTVELYDPVTGTWEQRTDMPQGTRSSAQVLLDDGRVLVTHGAPSNAFAYLYNVTSDTWTEADPSRSMIGGQGTRLGSRVVKLPNGQVLLTGNFCCPGNEAHIYDPSTNSFYPVDSMLKKRMAHSLTVLQDGSVLAAGGGTLNPSSLISNTAELFVPNTTSQSPSYLDGTWLPVSDMTAGHFDHEAARIETGLDTGKVLVCAGADGATYPGSYIFTNVCDLYDPSSQAFIRVGNIPRIRQRGGTGNGGDFLATVEAGSSNGTVVAAGGWPNTYSTNIYNPDDQSWSTKCNLNEPRLRHQTVGLLDGSVAILGGQLGPSSQSKRSVERLFLENEDDDCDGIANDVDICPSGGCGVISGRVYHAKNDTCESIDFGTANVMVRSDNSVTGDVRYAFTDENGLYAFDLPPGVWKISLVDSATIEEIDVLNNCSPYKSEIYVNAFSGQNNVDFPLKMNCNGVMVVEVSGLNGTECNGQPYVTPCPGFGFQYCFVITNQGSGWANVDLTFTVPTGMTFTGLGDNLCGFTITSIVGTDITVGLTPGGGPNAMGNGDQCRVCFEMDVISIPTGGWTASGYFEGTTGNGQNSLPCASGNATIVEPDECGCDPNAKSVYPVGCDEVGTYLGGPLAYTVRFQNEGLGPAYDVSILDQIDLDLDLQSMQLKGAASHSPTNIQIDNTRKLYVRFDDINLPAAKDDYEKSQGSLHFDIEPLAMGTQFTNEAEIYFDLNEVVITNEVTNTIGTCDDGPSNSGLGDGTNPGQGQGRGNSPNQGGGNPNNSNP